MVDPFQMARKETFQNQWFVSCLLSVQCQCQYQWRCIRVDRLLPVNILTADYVKLNITLRQVRLYVQELKYWPRSLADSNHVYDLLFPCLYFVMWMGFCCHSETTGQGPTRWHTNLSAGRYKEQKIQQIYCVTSTCTECCSILLVFKVYNESWSFTLYE